jgi:hypothetical protein
MTASGAVFTAEELAMSALVRIGIVPVEYAVAVDRYLAESGIGAASSRVYRISLTAWAWPLVGKLPPAGPDRRKAAPPVVPLLALDDPRTASWLAAAVAHRTRHTQARTVNRELSARLSAISWWRRQDWIRTDPSVQLRPLARPPVTARPLTEPELAALFRLPAGLREQALWHLLRDSGAPADAVLALDADMVDGRSRRARTTGGGLVSWTPDTWQLLSWLLAGRRHGPVFLTDRRAPAGTGARDVCPLTGRARMSYRRAAEIFAAQTRPLDPAGRGWMLHQLRRPPRPDPAARHRRAGSGHAQYT